MQAEYKKEWMDTYLWILPEHQIEDNYIEKMLLHNQGEGRLEFSKQQKEGEEYYCYKITGKKSVEYIDTKNGMNSLQQVVLMKRLFYEYKCSYFVIDSRGVGATLWDLFTVETFDEEFGVTYPAWTVNTDPTLQISSDNVINDKIQRAMSSNAKEVMIPIVSTAEMNNMIHLSLRKALKDGDIQLLLDDYDKKAKLEDKDPTFIMKSAEEKAEYKTPLHCSAYSNRNILYYFNTLIS